MAKWNKGDDYGQETSFGFGTYGISKDDHTNAIEVYTSKGDRDLILTLLRRYENYKLDKEVSE